VSLFGFWQESGVMASGDVLVGRAVRNLCLFEYVTIKTLEVLDFALLASALLLDDSVLWSSCLDKSLEGSHCFLRCCGCASHGIGHV